MPVAPMAQIVSYGVSDQEPLRESKQSVGAAHEQQVDMVAHQRPGTDIGLYLNRQPSPAARQASLGRRRQPR